MELNPDLAEAHSALGSALSLRKNYEESDRQFDLAIHEARALRVADAV